MMLYAGNGAFPLPVQQAACALREIQKRLASGDLIERGYFNRVGVDALSPDLSDSHVGRLLRICGLAYSKGDGNFFRQLGSMVEGLFCGCGAIDPVIVAAITAKHAGAGVTTDSVKRYLPKGYPISNSSIRRRVKQAGIPCAPGKTGRPKKETRANKRQIGGFFYSDFL